MNKEENTFKAYRGSIYKNNTGCIIEKIAFVVSRDSSVIKYGNAGSSLYEYYLNTVATYKSCGLEDMADNMFYVEFDKYESVLTVEEICTFANYIVMCACNGEDVYNMLKMNETELKDKIKTLAEYGY